MSGLIGEGLRRGPWPSRGVVTPRGQRRPRPWPCLSPASSFRKKRALLSPGAPCPPPERRPFPVRPGAAGSHPAAPPGGHMPLPCPCSTPVRPSTQRGLPTWASLCVFWKLPACQAARGTRLGAEESPGSGLRLPVRPCPRRPRRGGPRQVRGRGGVGRGGSRCRARAGTGCPEPGGGVWVSARGPADKRCPALAPASPPSRGRRGCSPAPRPRRSSAPTPTPVQTSARRPGKRPLCAQLGTGAPALAVSCSPSLGHRGPWPGHCSRRALRLWAAPGPPPPGAPGQTAPIHRRGCPCSCPGGSGPRALSYGLCSWRVADKQSSRKARRGRPRLGL